MQKLNSSEIQSKLKQVDGWKLKDQSIEKEWEFKDFKEAMVFINKIADLAEEHQHHPELFNVYNQVRLRFSTHSAGGITQKDFDIAAAIDDVNQN